MLGLPNGTIEKRPPCCQITSLYLNNAIAMCDQEPRKIPRVNYVSVSSCMQKKADCTLFQVHSVMQHGQQFKKIRLAGFKYHGGSMC